MYLELTFVLFVAILLYFGFSRFTAFMSGLIGFNREQFTVNVATDSSTNKGPALHCGPGEFVFDGKCMQFCRGCVTGTCNHGRCYSE